MHLYHFRHTESASTVPQICDSGLEKNYIGKIKHFVLVEIRTSSIKECKITAEPVQKYIDINCLRKAIWLYSLL